MAHQIDDVVSTSGDESDVNLTIERFLRENADSSKTGEEADNEETDLSIRDLSSSSDSSTTTGTSTRRTLFPVVGGAGGDGGSSSITSGGTGTGTSSNKNTAPNPTNWTRLNSKLQENGFNSLMVVETGQNPSFSAIFDVMHDLLAQFQQRGSIIQEMVLESDAQSRASSKSEHSLEKSKKQHDSQLDTVARLTQQKHELQKKVETLTKEMKQQKLQSEQEKKTLLGQVKHSEHRNVLKEQNMNRLSAKLQQFASKEQATQKRDAEVFQQLQSRAYRKQFDAKTLQIVKMYESQRERMETELRECKHQIHSLQSDVRDKENRGYNMSPDRDTNPNPDENTKPTPPPPNALLQRLETARREQESATMVLREREEIIMKKLKKLQQELQQKNEENAELTEQLANVTLEVKSRPSVHAYRTCTSRLEKTQILLANHQRALAEATDVASLRKLMDTKALISADRENHSLALNRLQTLPKSVLLTVVQQVCRLLNLSDLSLIAPSIQKLCRVMTAVPRMEAFVKDVCGLVRRDTGKEVALEEVVPILHYWATGRHELLTLQRFQTQVALELAQRSFVLQRQAEFNTETKSNAEEKPTTDKMSQYQCLSWITDLVNLEKSWLTRAELYEEVGQILENRPDVLINRIVSHFQYLFDVKTVQGVLPQLNATYLFVKEMTVFLNSVRRELGLDLTTSHTRCLESVLELLCQSPEKTKKSTSTGRAKNAPSSNYVVSKPGTDLVGLQSVRELHQIVKKVQEEVGAKTKEDILPRIKRLMIMLTQ